MDFIEVKNLTHTYGARRALDDVSFTVTAGEIFGFLGPNGSGKTTLFRILATVFAPTGGDVLIEGKSLSRAYGELRRKMGVVFQAPGLDNKLSVEENLKYHGMLYGYSGNELKTRCDEMLEHVALSARRKDIVGTLSGGLKRRVELAKGLLNKPALLLLDEPSTGLDPGARIDLWQYLKQVQQNQNVTILVTTHLMDEAEHCDRIAILNEGRLIKADTPDNLRSEINKDILIVETRDSAALAEKIKQRFNIEASMSEGQLVLEHDTGARFITALVEAFPGEIESCTFRKPTLEDVFVHQTGHRFWHQNEEKV